MLIQIKVGSNSSYEIFDSAELCPNPHPSSLTPFDTKGPGQTLRSASTEVSLGRTGKTGKALRNTLHNHGGSDLNIIR